MNRPLLVSGINPVHELLEAGETPEAVYLLKDLHNPRRFAILKTCRKRRIPVHLVPKQKLDAITGASHQGVIARMPEKTYVDIGKILANAEKSGRPPFVLIPEGVEDPHNLGALVRTALCAGVHGIVIPMTGSAGLTDGTSKASAGALSHMDVCRATDMPALLVALKEKGLKLAGFEAGEGKTFWEADLTGPLAVVLGGENRGIRPHIRRKLDMIVQIPVSGAVGSLNVSAAGAAAMYEVVRQRQSG